MSQSQEGFVSATKQLRSLATGNVSGIYLVDVVAAVLLSAFAVI
jgi:hypothetical protein